MNKKDGKEKGRKTEKIVIDGNAFYELDMECVERQENKRQLSGQKRKRQRN